MHELNGCIVGPGMYQEWTNHISAARNKREQNLELCRSLSNNMLYYKAIKPIKCGEQLLAWFSASVELELIKSFLKRDFLPPLASIDGILYTRQDFIEKKIRIIYILRENKNDYIIKNRIVFVLFIYI